MMRSLWYCNSNRSKFSPVKFVAVCESGAELELDMSVKYNMDWYEKVKNETIIGLATYLPKFGTWTYKFKNTHNQYSVRGDGFKTAKEALDDGKAEVKKAADEDAAMKANPLVWLETELVRHDWYCAYSDDHGVWAAGEAHMKLIQEIMAKCPKADAEAMFEQYRPKE